MDSSPPHTARLHYGRYTACTGQGTTSPPRYGTGHHSYDTPTDQWGSANWGHLKDKKSRQKYFYFCFYTITVELSIGPKKIETTSCLRLKICFGPEKLCKIARPFSKYRHAWDYIFCVDAGKLSGLTCAGWAAVSHPDDGVLAPGYRACEGIVYVVLMKDLPVQVGQQSPTFMMGCWHLGTGHVSG